MEAYSIEKDELETILNKAWLSMNDKQKNLFKLTKDSHQSEWNIAHHFANEIHEFFPYFDCDLELPKVAVLWKRPDIILHKRGDHSHNFLVIELKYNDSFIQTERDTQKITDYWFQKPYKYAFGAVGDIHQPGESHFMALKNDQRIQE